MINMQSHESQPMNVMPGTETRGGLATQLVYVCVFVCVCVCV